MEKSPNPYLMGSLGIKNAAIYANETYTSFFRRLTFTPDGSLLFTPAGQYKTSHLAEGPKTTDDVINTVYIYTRAGLNKPPIAHLPGHKKASIAVKCSPIFYTVRPTSKPTVNITIDTSSAEEAIAPLPDSVLSPKPSTTQSSMDPPPPTSMPSPMERPTLSPRPVENDTGVAGVGPSPAFALPYRIVYAVATQDAVLVYDTQQMTPIVVVSNLHFATFTDLTW
jgi:chromatin assembly factor 1 subunit B